MLKLLVQDVDIYRISKLLAKRNLKSSVTSSVIIIDSNQIANDIIDQIFEFATIIGAQNYFANDSPETTEIIETTLNENVDSLISKESDEYILNSENNNTDISAIETKLENQIINKDPPYNDISDEDNTPIPQISVELNPEAVDSEYYMGETSLYSKDDMNLSSKGLITESEMVFRGEVYKWGSIAQKDDGEGSIKECVIIIQNDYLNSVSDDTIALFCSSDYDKRAPIRFSFQLREATMMDHSTKRLEFFDHCTMFIGHIKGISRQKLGKYLGTMKNSFMDTLQPTIDFCLGLKRSRTVNLAQLQILSTINMFDLFEISESKVSNDEKTEKFLKLFNFDMSKNGMDYVKKSILIGYKLNDYRLEDLAKIVAKQEQAQADEVLRLIIARIKENFGFRKSPAISFIRLIDRLLRKG